MDSGSGASTSDEYISEDENHSSLAKNITAYGYEPSAPSGEEEQAAVDVPVRQPGPAKCQYRYTAYRLFGMCTGDLAKITGLFCQAVLATGSRNSSLRQEGITPATLTHDGSFS
nr:uncharacterized protein LOC129387129 [Dermacentor andersoni]